MKGCANVEHTRGSLYKGEKRMVEVRKESVDASMSGTAAGD